MKTIKFLASVLLITAMVVLVGCQPQNQPTKDSIIGVWQGDMEYHYEYGEFQGQYRISDIYWEFDNKGRWITTEAGEDYTCQYKLVKNNTKLQVIEGYDNVLGELTIKTLTHKKLEVEEVYFDDEGDEKDKYILSFKRIE